MFHFFGTKMILFFLKKDCFLRNLTILAKFANLHIHLYPIHLIYIYISKLPDFVVIQQLHSSCAFVEVVFERVSYPFFLDLTQLPLVRVNVER